VIWSRPVCCNRLS